MQTVTITSPQLVQQKRKEQSDLLSTWTASISGWRNRLSRHLPPTQQDSAGPPAAIPHYATNPKAMTGKSAALKSRFHLSVIYLADSHFLPLWTCSPLHLQENVSFFAVAMSFLKAHRSTAKRMKLIFLCLWVFFCFFVFFYIDFCFNYGWLLLWIHGLNRLAADKWSLQRYQRHIDICGWVCRLEVPSVHLHDPIHTNWVCADGGLSPKLNHEQISEVWSLLSQPSTPPNPQSLSRPKRQDSRTTGPTPLFIVVRKCLEGLVMSHLKEAQTSRVKNNRPWNPQPKALLE